jgi:hypothetical protein
VATADYPGMTPAIALANRPIPYGSSSHAATASTMPASHKLPASTLLMMPTLMQRSPAPFAPHRPTALPPSSRASSPALTTSTSTSPALSTPPHSPSPSHPYHTNLPLHPSFHPPNQTTLDETPTAPSLALSHAPHDSQPHNTPSPTSAHITARAPSSAPPPDPPTSPPMDWRSALIAPTSSSLHPLTTTPQPANTAFAASPPSPDPHPHSYLPPPP